MTKMTRKAMKELVENNLVGCDRVVFKKDGTVSLRRCYFYRHGQSAETWAELVKTALPMVTVVEQHDLWNPWPKDSYFEAVVKFPEVN